MTNKPNRISVPVGETTFKYKGNVYTLIPRTKCRTCNVLLTEEMKSHGRDKGTYDHEGLCCDCYDSQWK